MDRSDSASRPGRVTAGVAVAAVAMIALLTVNLGSPEPSLTSTPSGVALDPSEVYDPVRAGEPLPEGYRQLVGRDQIEPVYEPVFASADAVDWPEDMLLIGVAGVEAAKAYPVTHLNSREMVIDDIEGIPILVSW